MSTKIKYADESLGQVRVIKDFLPSPEELAFREESVKVTISLSKKSIDFFKTEASKYHTQYQRMIRQLLDSYAEVQTEQRQMRSTGHAKRPRAG
jgi:predicted DNA binding CopG/RHH family protein